MKRHAHTLIKIIFGRRSLQINAEYTRQKPINKTTFWVVLKKCASLYQLPVHHIHSCTCNFLCPGLLKVIFFSDSQVDCWSLGVILYAMVYKTMPFGGDDFNHLKKQITEGRYYDPCPGSGGLIINDQD